MKTQDTLTVDVRFMMTHTHEAPAFMTAATNRSFIEPYTLYGSEITTANLTQRLNAICDYAERQLTQKVVHDAAYVDNGVHKTGAVAVAGKVRIMDMQIEAKMNLQESEWYMLNRIFNWGY
jgi:hypothetical protein